jgi:elongator complex protein 4
MASLATKYSISHGAQCISSGVKAIDELIGGGYPLGSVVLVDSDPTLFHSELLLKYFLSQGLYNHEDLYVCSQLDASNYCDNLLSIIRSSSTLRQQSKSSASLAKGPPGRSSLRSEIIPEEEPSTEAKNDDMKIAWRYKDSGKKSSRLLSVGAGQSSFRKASKGSELSLKPLEISTKTVEYCSHFDLHMNPKKELLQEARDAKRLDGLKVNFGFESELLLKSLKAKLQDLSSNQILRIGISNFGSPEWFAEDSALDMARQLFKTLFSLKKQISGTNAVIVVSMSQSLLEAIGAYHTLLNICDISLSLNAFRENDTSPYAKDYSGIIKLNKLNSITKISPVTSLVQGLPCFTQTEFGFKLKRKRFYVDVLSLPPLDGDDGKESKENEKKNVNCSSTAW